MPGPVPKRSSERRRRNKQGRPQQVAAPSPPAVAPEVGDLHEVAQQWYDSLKESAQSQFYEPSDWAQAKILAITLSRYMKQERPISGPNLHALLSGMAELLTTEGARRRVRLEIERKGEVVEPVTAGKAGLLAFKAKAQA
jgi:hypothetical protein